MVLHLFSWCYDVLRDATSFNCVCFVLHGSCRQGARHVFSIKDEVQTLNLHKSSESFNGKGYIEDLFIYFWTWSDF